MTYPTADPVLMDPDCLQKWPSHINDTNWDIIKACKSNQPALYPPIILGVVWGAVIFLIFWSFFIARLSEIDTIRRLRRIPSYELHETIEAKYKQSLYTTAKKEWYSAVWKGRYKSIEYADNPNGHGGKRTITIVEDLNKVPKIESLGLSEIAVDKSLPLFRPRNAPTRPAAAVAASAAPTRPAVAIVAPEPRRDSGVSLPPEYLPPPPYTL
jgi:hypothetical protein